MFKNFPPEALADYVADGFTEAGDGVKLACTPDYEAATYCAQRIDPWPALAKVSCPLVLLRAEHNSTIPPSVTQRIAALKPDARIATLEGAGHMLPIERPERARAAIETAAMMAATGRRFSDDAL